MKTTKLVVSLIALSGLFFKASASDEIIVGGPAPITKECLINAQQGWIDGLLAIAEANRSGGGFCLCVTWRSVVA